MRRRLRDAPPMGKFAIMFIVIVAAFVTIILIPLAVSALFKPVPSAPRHVVTADMAAEHAPKLCGDVFHGTTDGNVVVERHLRLGASEETVNRAVQSVLKCASVSGDGIPPWTPPSVDRSMFPLFPNARHVTVRVWVPYIDDYGHEKWREDVNVTYSRATLDKIDFSTASPDGLLRVGNPGWTACVGGVLGLGC